MGQAPPSKAVATFTTNGVRGAVHFTSLPYGVGVAMNLQGVPPGDHGLHIHEFGDIGGDDCKKCGAHYNPSQRPHGGAHGGERHPGDLGNVFANDAGLVQTSFIIPRVCLRNLLGRSLVIHVGKDDLGHGQGAARRESMLTGNSGARLACAVIGLAQP